MVLTLQYLVDATPEQLAEVVQTNLLGSLLCTRTACRLMELQETGGHVFNMDGAGADGQPTPQYVAYGATKAGSCFIVELGLTTFDSNPSRIPSVRNY